MGISNNYNEVTGTNGTATKTLFAGSANNFYRSTDGGVTWAAITWPFDPDPNSQGVHTLAVAPNFSSSNLLIVGGRSEGYFRYNASTGARLALAPQGSGEVTGAVFSPNFNSDGFALIQYWVWTSHHQCIHHEC